MIIRDDIGTVRAPAPGADARPTSRALGFRRDLIALLLLTGP